MTNLAIAANGLRKSYGDKVVLDGIDLAVPEGTIPVDAMPGWFQPIAEYQPFTPAIETLRGLLLGGEIGHNGWLAVAWCVALAVLGYVWWTSTFNRDPK